LRLNHQIENNIRVKIDSFLLKGYKKTESFHCAILIYSSDIEINYLSVEDKRKLAEGLGYTRSMGQEIQKLVNLGKIMRECKLDII